MSNSLEEIASVYYGRSPNAVRVDESVFCIYGTGGQVGFSREPLFAVPIVVVARKGTLSNPTYSVNPCWVIDTAYAVVSKKNFDTKWLYYNLSNYDLESLNEATGVPSISRDYLYRIRFYSPPLPQQRKIAKILTTVDNLIEKTEQLIAKYQSIKQGMMHDLFTRGVDSNGKLRPPQSEAPELYKQSELGWIPKEWEVERLENHLDRIDQGWSPDCDSEPATAGEWGVLKTTAVVWNGFNDLENKKLPKHLKPEPKYEVKVNDVLMTRGGPNSRVGVVVFVNETRSRLMLSDKIYRISLKQSVLPNYIALALSSKSTQIHLSTLKTGLAESQTNISQKIVKQLLVSIPNLKEQLIICKHIRKTEDFLNSNLRTLLEWKTIKTALMQDLLTGKVQITPDEIDKELAHA